MYMAGQENIDVCKCYSIIGYYSDDIHCYAVIAVSHEALVFHR